MSMTITRFGQRNLSSVSRIERSRIWLNGLGQHLTALFQWGLHTGVLEKPGTESLVLHYHGRTMVLGGSIQKFRMGRSPCNELIVNQKLASRKHAVIEFQHGQFILTDYSRNGTYLTMENEARAFIQSWSVTLSQQGIINLGRKAVGQDPDIIRYQVVLALAEIQRQAEGNRPELYSTVPENAMDLIDRTLTQLTFSPTVQRFRNLMVFPLLAEESVQPGYLTLDQALRQKVARISEVSERGTVPELQFENLSDAPVLLVDGEEVVGMKQNRIINLSILISGRQTREIPVSCVEQGRWSHSPRRNGATGHQHYARARARKAEQVSNSLTGSGTRYSNQGEIWRDIDEKFTTLQGHSRTGAMTDLYEQVADRLESYDSAFYPQPFQVGAVFAIADRIVGVECFDSDQTFAGFFSKLIESYAMDALEQESVESVAPQPEAAQQFLQRIRNAPRQSYLALGEGEDVRFMEDTVSGGALIADGRVVHLAAFDCA